MTQLFVSSVCALSLLCMLGCAELRLVTGPKTCGAGCQGCLTAVPITSKWAPRSSGPEPMKALAGKLSLK